MHPDSGRQWHAGTPAAEGFVTRVHDVRVTLRQECSAYRGLTLFTEANSYTGVDVRVTDRVIGVIADFHPEAVINAVGVVKQRKDGLDPIPNLEINALLPHRLAAICNAIHAHLIHISTDCVFSGKTGNYTEEDIADLVDVYGHSKFLGEVVIPGCITLRTSIIGMELSRKTSLFEWFLAQTVRTQGYKNAIFFRNHDHRDEPGDGAINRKLPSGGGYLSRIKLPHQQI